MENTRLGNVRLIRKLGEGGMGAVWLGQHETLDKQVAVKILPAALARDAAFCERFIREARAAAKLEHPNVIQVLDADNSNGTHYIIMQYVEGIDLQKAIKKKGALPIRDCLSIVKRVAAALAAAHELGMIHRDIKPSNIMVTGKGRVFVGDFGLARDVSSGKTVTGAEQVVGTPHYMSPEQARGERLDARSDMYSLGATLYAMLTARPPFEAETPVAVMVKHAREDVNPEPVDRVNPQIPRAVGALVERMMAKDPKDRFPDMKDAIAAVDAIKDGPTVVGPITKSPPGADAPTVVAVPARAVLPSEAAVAAVAAPPKRARWWIPAGIGAAAMLMALVCLGVLAGNKPTPAETALKKAEEGAAAAGDDPDKLRAAADRYLDIVRDFPNSPQAADAKTKGDALVAKADKLAFRRAVDAVDLAYGRGELEFIKALDEIKKIEALHPTRLAEVRDYELRFHKARLLKRSHELVRAMMARDDKAVEGFMHPGERKTIGGAVILEGFKRFVKEMNEGDAVTAEPTERLIEIDLEKNIAKIPYQLTVKKPDGTTAPGGLKLAWKLGNDDWYVSMQETFEKPPRRGPRDSPPPRDP